MITRLRKPCQNRPPKPPIRVRDPRARNQAKPEASGRHPVPANLFGTGQWGGGELEAIGGWLCL